jgi:iron(III) transport system substrate-binding protein
LASLISYLGEQKAQDWALGIVNNFSRSPKGNDRTQMTSVVLGECDITLANTYYLGKWISSEKEKERQYANKISVFFPNQKDRGAHINISGAAVVKYAKNPENAIKLIEFLASDKAQELYAKSNHEYPIRDNISVSDIVQSWGYPFKKDRMNLEILGKNNNTAVQIFDKVNWQ